MQNNAEQSSTWLDRPLTQNIHISWEVGILVRCNLSFLYFGRTCHESRRDHTRLP